MLGVNENTIDGADHHALPFLKMPYALGTFISFYLVDKLALVDRIVRTLGFTNVAVNALVGNIQCHGS